MVQVFKALYLGLTSPCCLLGAEESVLARVASNYALKVRHPLPGTVGVSDSAILRTTIKPTATCEVVEEVPFDSLVYRTAIVRKTLVIRLYRRLIRRSRAYRIPLRR